MKSPRSGGPRPPGPPGSSRPSGSSRPPSSGARTGGGPGSGPGQAPRGRASFAKPAHGKPAYNNGAFGTPVDARTESKQKSRFEPRPNPRPLPPAERPVSPARLSLQRPPDAAPPEQGAREAGSREPRGRQHAAEAPRGTVWLYGTHAIAAALGNPSRRLRRLLLTEEAEAALAERVRQPWPLATERVDRARLDTLLGRDTVHQGAALLADLLAPPALAAALERRGPVLVLDQVSDPRNVGAILRCAAAFGAACVIVQERNAPEETGALAKAASGALETVPLLRAVNIARTLIALKAAGCWTVALDAGGGALSGPALGQRRVALVLGAEGEGLRRLTRDTCDEVAGIAMPGGSVSLDSLNVAAAAAVALYELGRRG